MEKIRRISTCPNCGADVSNIDPASLKENKCPFCGSEIYDHSKEIYDEKIEGVKQAKIKLIHVQIIIAVLALAVVVAGGIYILQRTVYRSTDQYVIDQSDNMTKKLNKAYEKEDWETLFDLVILKADDALSSPYYFSYRAAWMLSEYPNDFDKGVSENDKEAAMKAFKEIRYEYEYREKLAEVYLLVPEIEEKLEKEYLREKEIVEGKGWLE